VAASSRSSPSHFLMHRLVRLVRFAEVISPTPLKEEIQKRDEQQVASQEE